MTGPRSKHGIAERSLIDSIAAELAASDSFPSRDSRVLLGVGDDAAIVRARSRCVTSVDTMVEGVHFRLDDGWASVAEVGHRALAGALSDLAAMGADGGEAYLALGLPAGFAEQHALELVRAACTLAGETGTRILGGDVVVAPVLMVSITAVGWADEGDRLLRRDGARAGDLIGVTGTLGAAAAALAVMSGRAGAGTAAAAAALARARRPLPRLREGRALAGAGAHAMIDLSDGLAADAAQIALSSGTHLRVELGRLPLHSGVAEIAAEIGVPAYQLAAGGGEDYELCFCAPAAARALLERAVGDVGVAWVGEVSAGRAGLTLSDERGDAVRVEGFEHRW